MCVLVGGRVEVCKSGWYLGMHTMLYDAHMSVSEWRVKQLVGRKEERLTQL